MGIELGRRYSAKFPYQNFNKFEEERFGVTKTIECSLENHQNNNENPPKQCEIEKNVYAATKLSRSKSTIWDWCSKKFGKLYLRECLEMDYEHFVWFLSSIGSGGDMDREFLKIRTSLRKMQGREVRNIATRKYRRRGFFDLIFA